MLATLSFGKRRRKTSSSKSHHKKPPAKLLKLCKKYRVKATKKVGSRRVYKKVSVLKRQCLKKAKALKKKLMKMHKKTTHRRSSEMGEEAMMFGRRRARKSHHTSFGLDDVDEIPDDLPMSAFGRYHQFGGMMVPMVKKHSFGRYPQFGGMMDPMKTTGFGRSQFGSCPKGQTWDPKQKKCHFGSCPKGQTWNPKEKKCSFGNMMTNMQSGMATGLATMANKVAPSGFGKRRRSPKVSKAAAMKAFRAFYKRHCSGNRRMRFGSSNPPLVNSMGYEFCSDGVGGVLGSNSTGLFPSPCVSASSSGADRSTTGDVKAAYKEANAERGAFGRRRRAKKKAATKKAATKKADTMFGSAKKKDDTKFGRRRRANKKADAKCYYGRA